MKEISDNLIKHESLEEEFLLSELDRLSSILDIHPVNALNFAKFGGLKLILDLIFRSTHKSLQYESLLVFSNMI